MVSGISTLILILLLPLIVVVGATIGFFKSGTLWSKWISARIAALSLTGILYLSWQTTPYLYACYLESNWRVGKPKTKAELESYLSLYREHEINVEQSLWGRHHPIQEGHRMVQDLIMWREPLDVV